jgi:putative FmdB family regulatory protein
MMPIFTYRCRTCGERFSTLLNAGETAVCKACESEDLERQLSLIAAPAKGRETPAIAACGAPMEACCGGGSCDAFADA